MRGLEMKLDNRKRVTKALAPFTGMVLALFFLVLAAPGSIVSYAQDPQQDPPPPPKRQPPAKPAQEAPPEIGPDEVVRVSSNLVVVPVSVTDVGGNPVRNLKASDFRLEEAGKTQEIAQVGTPDEVPLDIALLFDLSSSVSSRFAFQQQAASRFLKEVLRPTDTATIYAIDSEGHMVQPRGSVDAAVAKLMSFKAATVPTPTAFYDSVKAAATYLAQNAPKDHRRVILVISDGDDNFSAGIKDAAIADYKSKTGDASTVSIRETAHATLDALHHRAQLDVQRVVQRADTVFFSINPSGDSIRLNVVSTRAQNGMQALADATGGSSFVPNTDQDLERVFKQIAAELRAQYLLQYYSNDESPTGKFVPLKVSLPAQPQMRVRARLGYYAKKG
jgi:Ca-activated chloride channel family protein